MIPQGLTGFEDVCISGETFLKCVGEDAGDWSPRRSQRGQPFRGSTGVAGTGEEAGQPHIPWRRDWAKTTKCLGSLARGRGRGGQLGQG